ncbi:MAG TPA: PilZ domain-containing protein [Candidatus Acidoferrum sp.]|nr:PilZ domain-containing protein [Candidatus Acidoferrum sp.]
MQRRQHPRVRLRIPARLRWSAPLGQRIEPCETINTSRGGLLLACGEAPSAGHSLWVTFPFDADASAVQPEVLARVMRRERSKEDTEKRWKVGLQFERAEPPPISGNGKDSGTEKKNGAGRNIALPIRVRPQNVPWHEEAMTMEVSPGKVKFVTNREYAFGQRLLVSFDARSDAPWVGDQEWEGEVTGIEMEADSDSVTVTVRKKSA